MSDTPKSVHTVGDSIQFGTLPEVDRQFVVDALNKGANRRQVMGWLMSMGATIASAGAIVTAASDAIAATPKKGGTVRVATDLHGPNDTLDPPIFQSTMDFIRGRIIYNNLCRLKEDLTAGPELAESFEANATATEWTFKLRRDVEWHDGSKLTADDVIYSMNQHIGADSVSKAKVLVGDVTEWKKDDDHTVRAILKAPNAELPVVLGTFNFKIVKDGTTDFSKPVGTGPFTLDEFIPGVRSIHSRNDNYWNDKAGPYLDRIEAFGITDGVARVNALIAGDVQMITNVNPQAMAQVEAAAGVEGFVVPSGVTMDIISRTDNNYAGANHYDFDSALKYLQRRERILKVVQKGIGAIGNDQPVGEAYGAAWCKEANDPPRPYDPDKAKFHFKKSGITSAELKVADVAPGIGDIALMLQRECSKVGFDLHIKKVPNDGYWSTIWNKDPLCVASWNMRPSANIMMTLRMKSDAPWNDAAFKNERFDQLLAMARAELDAKKRHEMNCEMQTLAADRAGLVIPVHRAYSDGISSKVKGLPRVPIGVLGGIEWPEFVWLDS